MITADGATHVEGDAGVSYALFTVYRTGDLSGPSTVQWSTVGSGANAAAASDFPGGILPSGIVYFGGGEAAKKIWVPVAGDRTPEADEGFTINLSNPTGAQVSIGAASRQINNDDGFYAPATPPADAVIGQPQVPASPSPAPVQPTWQITHTGTEGVDYFKATNANDGFILNESIRLNESNPKPDVIFNFQAGGDDTALIELGPQGPVLAHQSGAGEAVMVDFGAPAGLMANADVIRWTGQVRAMDSAAEVDKALASMPGTFEGGVLVVAYDSGLKVGLYYDPDANTVGGAVQLVSFNNLVSTSQLTAQDLVFI